MLHCHLFRPKLYNDDDDDDVCGVFMNCACCFRHNIKFPHDLCVVQGRGSFKFQVDCFELRQELVYCGSVGSPAIRPPLRDRRAERRGKVGKTTNTTNPQSLNLTDNLITGIRTHPPGQTNPTTPTSSATAENGPILPIQRNDPHTSDVILHFGGPLARLHLVRDRREGKTTQPGTG